MSFLSGIIDAGKAVVGFVSGNSIASSLLKTVALGYAMNRLSQNATLPNNTDTTETANIDAGVRLQIAPAANNKIPVLYGTAFFGGIITDAAMTNNNKTMWYAVTLAEKTGTKLSDNQASAYVFKDIYWNDQRIVFNSDGITVSYTVDRNGNIDRSLANLVKVYCYAGNSTSGQVPENYTGTVPAANTLMPNWGSNHTMSNLIFALVRVDYNRDKGVQGIGNMMFHVANSMYLPGDVLYDYMPNNMYGAGISVAEINTTQLAALNTYSAESVAYDDQGTGAQTLADRYQINGLLDTKNTVMSNIERICNACASWLSYDSHEGKWGVVINKAGTSVASFNDSNILGNIDLSGVGLTELYNIAEVQFPHRDLRDSADFVNIELDPAFRNDNEEDNPYNITYDIINEPIQAQLLGFIELKQSRIDQIIQFQTDFSFINLKAGDVIDVSDTRFGFNKVLYRIITITEVQEDDGALKMDITAQKYDADVYVVSNADLYRYTRTDANGIITIGSIGQPGTPQVTKIEQDARPRIIIESTAPTGVVEGLEYWISTDVSEPNDEDRSYTLIGTKRPVGGGVFTSGTVVVLEYDSLNATNFVVKTRGFNTTTVGLYSEVSGAVEYTPVQTTNAITPETQAFDATGGMLTALGVSTLLSLLGGLFGSDATKSLFDKVFETFKDVTGVDLVGEASSGDLVVASSIKIKSQGAEISTTVSSFDFKQGLRATGSGDISVKIMDGTAQGQMLIWTGSDWALQSSCCPYNPIIPPTPVTPVACSIAQSAYLPASAKDTIEVEKVNLDPKVPNTGSYYVKFALSTTAGTSTPSQTVYGSLTKGTGNIKMYSTDGKLHETIAASALKINKNVVEIPWTKDRELGTDYYITMDEGVITYCGCKSKKIDDAATWNFRVSLRPLPAYDAMAPDTQSTYIDGARAPELQVRKTGNNFSGYAPYPEACSNTVNIELGYPEEVQKLSGNVLVKKQDTGTVMATLSVESATLSEDKKDLKWTSVSGLAENVRYEVEVPAGIVKTMRTASTGCAEVELPQLENKEFKWSFLTGKPLAITSYLLNSDPHPEGTTKVHPLSNIQINFNKTIAVKESGAANVHLYEKGLLVDSIVQTFNLNGTYTADKIGIIDTDGGTALKLQPTRAMKAGKTYYIKIESGAILDAACNVIFAGINDESISWTIDSIETVSPPPPDPNTPLGESKVSFEFGRPVEPGTGSMNIVDSTGKVLAKVPANDPAITYTS